MVNNQPDIRDGVGSIFSVFLQPGNAQKCSESGIQKILGFFAQDIIVGKCKMLETNSKFCAFLWVR